MGRPGARPAFPLVEGSMLFGDLFVSRTDVYAIASGHSYSPIWKEWGKEEIQDHISGKKSVGLYLVRPDGNAVRMLVLDLDIDDQAAVQAIAANLTKSIPDTALLLERTGSRGWHVWVFFDDWLPSAVVRALARGGL